MVSIVIPLYNGSKFIRQTINSCLDQDYNDIEVIVIDDCSKDDSYYITKRISDYHDNVKLIKNESNLGFCKTANKGIMLSNGEYILVLGQDDIIKKDHISLMLKSFDNSVGAVYCGFSFIDEKGNVSKDINIAKGREVSISDFVYQNAISSVGLVIRADVAKKIGGYPEYKKWANYGEWYFWINIASMSRIVYNDKAIALYRRHSDNITNTFSNKKSSVILNKYWDKCRLLALKQGNFSFSKKLSILKYIYIGKLKRKTKNIFSLISRVKNKFFT